MRLAIVAAGVALMLTGIGAAQPRKPAAAPTIEYKLGPHGQVGLVVRQKSKRIPLTYAKDGSTSSTVVRVDGRDVEFGSDHGEWRQRPTPFGKTKEGAARHGHWCAWSVVGVTVTQVVEIVPSDTRQLDTCLVYYTIENGDDGPRDIGLRVMIDTQIASNDGNSFAVGGRTVINHANFKEPKDVPTAIEVRETSDPDRLGFIANLTVKIGGDIHPPDRCSLTHWPGPLASWEIPLENIEEDAAVALYWNPRRFPPNAQFHVGYAYGQGLLNLGK
ncbi:MAG: hypothetical protein L0Y71_15430 [Gemmataceae bacterium]|nr:hypothetical protein [Gemmataceae bacterium]